jgi:hypothetical protein
MILSWPVSVPTLTITVRNPKLGDTYRVDSNTIVRENRAGDPLVVRGNWPFNTVLNYTIETLDNTEIAAFESFIKQSAADEILIDFNGIWQGIIITPIIEIITKRNNDYQAQFEFMGKEL